MTSASNFDRDELTRKTLDTWADLFADYSNGKITGPAFRVAFLAVWQTVSGIADCETLQPVLDDFNEEDRNGGFQ